MWRSEALRLKLPSLLLTAQTWKSDRSSHAGLHSDVACFLLVPFTIPLAGFHFTWVKIIIRIKERGREPRNQTQATEMGTVEKEFKAELWMDCMVSYTSPGTWQELVV